MLANRLRAAGNVGASIPTDGLVAWYTMDNIIGTTLIDEMGNYNATITGATQTTGVIGQALYMPTAGDFVTASGPVITSVTSVSFSFWLRLDSLSDFNTVVSRYTEGSSNRGVMVVVNAAGQVVIASRSDIGNYRYSRSPTGTILANNNYQISINVRPNGSYDLWVNGVLIALTAWLSSGSLAAWAYNAGEPFKIGAAAGLSGAMSGWIDQLRIYQDYTITQSLVDLLVSEP